MSVFTDMVPATLQVNKAEKGASGAVKDNYVNVSAIDVSIYKNDAFKGTQSAKYEKSTHSACTFFKGFQKGEEYRLLIGKSIYYAVDINTLGRFTTLLLTQVVMK